MRKRFFYLLFALLSLTMLSSCNTQFGMAYNVSITGDGDGDFKVTFPQGYYAMDGTASLDLYLGDTLKFNDTQVTYKADVLKKANKKELAAMQAVNDSIANNFQAFVGKGTYDIWIKGVVTEIGTGLSFKVNKHLTNQDNLRKAPPSDEVFCPYIE